jgi:transposase-like protein
LRIQSKEEEDNIKAERVSLDSEKIELRKELAEMEELNKSSSK